MLDTNLETKNELIESEVFYGLEYDRVFKTIFYSKKEINGEERYPLLERLIYEATKIKLKIKNIVMSELPVKNTLEKTKRLDLLIECEGAFVNIELNSNLTEEIIVRNENYFSAFVSSIPRIGQSYDIKTKYIQISLSFNMEKDLDKTVYNTVRINKKTQYLFMHNKKKFHINLDVWRKVWYDDVAKEDMKATLVTLLSLKKKEDILKYKDMVDDPEIKECVDEIMKLNGDFIKSFWKFSPEQEDEMLQKARDERMRDEGMAVGEAKGLAAGKAEGLAVGKAEGLAAGKAEGLAVGKAEGLAVGKAEGKKAGILQIAKNMLKENCDIGLISKVTKLSTSEIKTLM